MNSLPALSKTVMPLAAKYRFELSRSKVFDDDELVPLANLPAVILELEQACEPAPEETARKATALLVGGYPNAKPHDPEIYVEAMARQLAEYPADVLAETVRRCHRELKFLPAIAEVVEIADSLIKDRRHALKTAQIHHRMHDCQLSAEREREAAERHDRALSDDPSSVDAARAAWNTAIAEMRQELDKTARLIIGRALSEWRGREAVLGHLLGRSHDDAVAEARAIIVRLVSHLPMLGDG